MREANKTSWQDSVDQEIRVVRQRGDYRPVVVAIIRDEVDRVLLVQSARNATHWSPPQGGIEDHETAAQAVYREVAEEVGILASQLVQLGYLGCSTLDAEPERVERRGFSRGKCYFFFTARYQGLAAITLNHEELTGYQWVSKNAVGSILATTRPEKRNLLLSFFVGG